MPMPIRPVNQTDSIFPAAMGDERGMGLFGLQNSPMQLMMKEELERRENKKIVAERKGGVDSRDVELIHRLWMEQEESGPVMAAAEARGRVSMQVPNSTSSYDLMRLKTNGLAIGSGNVITLTKRGEKLLKDKILATPSSFWLNRSKDGFDMRAAEPRRSKLVKLSQAAGNHSLEDSDEFEGQPSIEEERSRMTQGASSLRKAVRTAQMSTPPGYGNVFDPNPARRPQVQSEPIDQMSPEEQMMGGVKPNPPGFWDWYRKELQPGRGKNVDARDQYVRQHASGWLNPFFRPWAAKEYYDKAMQYAPNEYPYLPSEKELEMDARLEQERKDYERFLRSPESKRFPIAPPPPMRSEAPGGWGQTVMAANEAARMALAQETENDESGTCPDCKGTGEYPGGYRKRTSKCFTCSGTGRV